MKRIGLVMLMVACLLVAVQVSADVHKASNFPEFIFAENFQAETKIESQEDVIDFSNNTAVIGERIAVLSDCSIQNLPVFIIGDVKDKGILEPVYYNFLTCSEVELFSTEKQEVWEGCLLFADGT